ncbi:DUF4865 family protein [Neorhizobium sp. NPDC001467]|uniref:DUF4865 family protein n=1 Tax=Neorhizobium sp. NPDC001467 TaxID=3390595 RepID=UPI003CFFCDFF
MIAMQYSFTLPADYDMSIIDRRIRDNGHKLDGFPNLGFKAYLTAKRGDGGSTENLYAPFYLWERPEGMDAFLSGPGFRGVSSAFGWPTVSTWIVWHQQFSDDVVRAQFASRRLSDIPPHSDLSEVRFAAIGAAKALLENGAASVVAAFDPRGWTLVEFSLWNERPRDTGNMQVYGVGHVSV